MHPRPTTHTPEKVKESEAPGVEVSVMVSLLNPLYSRRFQLPTNEFHRVGLWSSNISKLIVCRLNKAISSAVDWCTGNVEPLG